MKLAKEMITLKGQTASGGMALGRLFFYRKEETKVDSRRGFSPEEEEKRLQKALEMTAKELAILEKKTEEEVGSEEAAVFFIHRMMLEDEDLLSLIRGRIEMGHSVEYAISEGAKTVANRLMLTGDDYMKERSLDVTDVKERLLACLSGGKKITLPPYKEGVILCAEELTPGETVLLDKSRLAAFLLSGGSVNSHTAILARSMGVPAVVAMGKGLFSLPEGEIALADATTGRVTARPDEAALATYSLYLADEERERSFREKARGKQVVTRTGHRVEICGNIGSAEEVEAVLRQDGDGIGLFRSEFLFLGRSTPPDEEEQLQAYRKVLSAMKGKRVVVRTLDIGADKQVPYLGMAGEENPAMGLRGIRLSLEEKDLFRRQLRALLRASNDGKLAILFPMIASCGEVIRAKATLKEVAEEMERAGEPFSHDIEIGVMIETPAAALISHRLAKEVDFFSVGTNDLSQYTLAIDRQNAKAAAFFDPHHEAVLSLISFAAENAHANGIWIGICGELAADKTLAKRFLDMGIDELSMVPSAILPLKAHLLSLCEQ